VERGHYGGGARVAPRTEGEGDLDNGDRGRAAELTTGTELIREVSVGDGGERRSAMEVEAGEIVTDGSDFEMPELSVEMPELSGDGRMFDVRSGGDEWPRLGSSNGRTTALEDSACSKEIVGASNVKMSQVTGDLKGDIPQDVLLAAEAAMPGNGNGNGVREEEEDESEGDGNADGMVEADSDPQVESDESSDASSDEEEDVNAADMQKSHIEGAEELDQMVKRAKEVDSEEEDGATTEPPRTANEVTVFFLNFELK